VLVVPVPVEAPPAYRRTFRRLLADPGLTDRHDGLLMEHSIRLGLDARLLKAIIAAESEFKETARSPKGARGLMQVMPRTGELMGVEAGLLFQPEHNIRAGAGYLLKLFTIAAKRYNLRGVRYHGAPRWLIQRVIASYHAGPRYLFRTRWLRQTRAYVRKVMLFYQTPVTDIRRTPKPAQGHPDIPMSSAHGLLF
jgi:soluble lytic murein transglycosylase-like protein